MLKNIRHSGTFKLFSLFVAVVFLWNDLCWAGAGDVLSAQIGTDPVSSSLSQSSLESRQSSSQSTIDTLNAIEAFSSPSAPPQQVQAASAPPVYTYYASGRMSSVTLSAPDESGNVHYSYLDENWNNLGYGRVYRSRRETALNGELCHSYTYNTDTYKRLQTKKGYSDGAWAVLVFTLTYYNDTYNRLATKTLVSPDSEGNIYYAYVNENWNNQGFGKVSKLKRQTAIDGELSFIFSYYADTYGRLSSKKGYAASTWTTLVSTRTYHNVAGNFLASKTLVTADVQGNNYYSYISENWNDQGFGRISRIRRSVALNGEWAYTYTYYADATGRLSTKKVYAASNWTGAVTTYTYYNDANMYLSSITLAAPDASGNNYYSYLNENWNGQGIGRISKSRRAVALNGEWTYTYTYYADATGRLSTKKVYAASNWTGSVTTYAYYNDANTFLSSKTLPVADAFGNNYYTYLNENWNHQGFGRIAKSRKPAAVGGERSYVYTYNSDATGRLANKKAYSTSSWTTLVATYTYYNDVSNFTATKTLVTPDAQGNNCYNYINENWNNQGFGYIIKKIKPDGTYSMLEGYYTGTDQARFAKEYSAAGVFLRVKEYDANGSLISQYNVRILSDTNYALGDGGNGKKATFVKINGAYLTNTLLAENGDFTEWERDANGTVTGWTIVRSDNTRDVYNASGVLMITEIGDNAFVKGFNLPWINYGYDLGMLPASTYHDGFSGNESRLFTVFNDWKASYARVFLFADLRSSMNFDASGMPLGFTDKVYDDARCLFDMADTFGIKLIPVLFDYTIGDGVTKEGIYKTGEHPDVVTDGAKRQALLDIFGGFFDEYAAERSVYAWDVINEPEYAKDIPISDAQSFVSDLAELIHSKNSSALVTVGSRNRSDMVKYWTDSGLDVYQYHYYDGMADEFPLDVNANSLNVDKPVLAGELEPTALASKLGTLGENGYIGGLFWQDSGGFTISDAGRVEIRDWFTRTKVTYGYYASGRKRSETTNRSTVRLFEDAAFYADGDGRMISETLATSDRAGFEYYSGTDTVKTVSYFTPSGSLEFKKEFSASGDLSSVSRFSTGGALSAKFDVVGTWQLREADGALRENAVVSGTDIIAHDNAGHLLRKLTADGSVYEYDPLLGASAPIRVLRSDGSAAQYFYSGTAALLARHEYAIDGSVKIFGPDGVLVDMRLPAGAPVDNAAAVVSLTTALGDKINYLGDEIVSIELEEDGSLLTDIEFDTLGNLKNALRTGKDGSVSVIYSGEMVETVYSDGTRAIYRDNRKVSEYSAANGWTRSYYTLNTDESISGIVTFNSSAVCFYEGLGTPVDFYKLAGGWTHYEAGHLDRIVADGNEKYVYDYSTSGGAASSKLAGRPFVTKPEVPVEIIYQGASNAEPVSIKLQDGTLMNYEFGLLKEILGLTARIDLGTGEGSLAFDNGKYAEYYNDNGELERIVDRNNTSVYFSDGEITAVETEGGSRVLYRGGKITDLYDAQEGAHYETDDVTGRISSVTYDDGRVYTYSYLETAPGELKTTITDAADPANVTIRFYEDDYLVRQELPSGLISVYEYEQDPANPDEKRITLLTQTKNGRETARFTYEYLAGKTVVTDLAGSKREYDEDGNTEGLYTQDGYVYSYTRTEYDTLVMTLDRKEYDDGRSVYYRDGDVDRVLSPDGTVLKEPVFDDTGILKSFTAILPDNSVRRVTVHEEGWTEIVAPDGTKLIYKNNVLVAVNAYHRLVVYQDTEKIPSSVSLDISDDPGALFHLERTSGNLTEYEIQKLYKEYNIHEHPMVDYVGVGASRSWRMQAGAYNTQGVTSVTSSPDVVTLTASLHGGSATASQGEAYLDLTYPAAGTVMNGRYDFDGKRLSYYVKLEDGMLTTSGRLTVQAFVKTGDTNGWRSEYSTEITMTEDGVWYRIDFDISNQIPPFGVMDPGFDPTQIRLAGVRVKSNDPGFTYNGQIYLKDANNSEVPEGERVINMPFLVNKASVQPYVGVILDDQPAGGNPGYISWSDIPTVYQGVEDGEDQGVMDLDISNWRVQDYKNSLGVESVTRDDANDQWVLGLDLKAGDAVKNDGEMFVDLRYDVPGYTWDGPINLTGKSLSFKVKAPAGFLAATGEPMWAQVFVKDENNNHQYGKYVLITSENVWLDLTLDPQFGEIEEGNSETSPDFDPAKIVHIGVKISCNKSSAGAYTGEFYVRNATSPDVLNEHTPIYLIDANALKDYAVDNNIVITFEESLGPLVELARESLPGYFKDSSFTMATEYYPSGRLRSILKGNQRIEHYDTEGKLVSITDRDLKTIVSYRYGSSGDLIEVNYSGLRDDIRQSMDDARVQAAQAASDTIIEMAEAKNYAQSYVDSTINPAINECQKTRADLSRMRDDWDSKHFGWWEGSKKEEKKQAVSALEDAIRQVDARVADLKGQASALYAQIDANIASAKDSIEFELDASLTSIDAEEDTAILNSLEQEITEVAAVYYKKFLGRTMSQSEMDGWFTAARANGCLNTDARVAFDASLIVSKLETDAAYIAERESNDAFIAGVITGVESELDAFKNLSSSEKAAYLASLGIAADEALYGEADFDTIIKWLGSNNRHFGKSAFFALKKMFAEGTVIDLNDLAVKTILTDIFTNSITSVTSGELVISMYALKLYAESKGLTLYASKIDKSDASLRYILASGKKAILRLDGNHFVTITSIDAAGNVTYYEPSQNTAGETLSMDSATFLKAWDGYALSERGPPVDGISRVLTNQEAMLVRGSNPVLLVLFIISVVSGVISAALSFIDNEICQMLSRIFGIISLAAGVLNIVMSLPTILQNFASGLANIGTNVAKATGDMGTTIIEGIKGFASGIPALVGKAVIAISLNMAYTNALMTFGVNSNIASLTGAFLSGGFIDTFSSIAAYGSNGAVFGLTNGLTSLVIEGTRYVGNVLSLDQGITDIIGMAAGSIVNAGFGGVWVPQATGDPIFKQGLEAISYTIQSTVLPNVAGELAYYGITKLGEMIGIDESISQLAGIGLRSSLRSGLSANWQGSAVWSGVQQGLLQGVTSIGLNYATQELGLNPLLANIGFSAIAAGINSGIQAITGVEKDVFKSFFGTFTKNALTFLGYDPAPGRMDDRFWQVNPENGLKMFNESAYNSVMITYTNNYTWQKTAYTSQILDFSQITRERGLVNALDTYATGFFNSVAVGEIVKAGYTVGSYFNTMLQQGLYTNRTLADGKTVKQVAVKNTQGQIISNALFEQTTEGGTVSAYWDYLGYEDISDGNAELAWGDIGVDSFGKMGYTDAQIESVFGADIEIQKIVNGEQAYAEIKDAQGNTLLVVSPGSNRYYNVYNSYGEYVDSVINSQGYEITISDGVMKFVNNNSGLAITVDDNKITDLSLFNFDRTLTSTEVQRISALTNEQKIQLLQTSMLFGNGFMNDGGTGNLPHLMQLFMSDLMADGVITSSTAYGIPLYENANIFEDAINWGLDAWTSDATLTNQLLAEIDAWYNNLTPAQKAAKVVYFAHSGNFSPLIEGLNARPDIKVDTIISYEGPYVGSSVIDNPNLKRIINVTGTAAPVTVKNPYQLLKFGAGGLYLDVSQFECNDYYVPFLQKTEFQSSTGIENINFEVIGAKHSDFSYDPSLNLTGAGAETNLATNIFMRKLSEAAMGVVEWNDFVTRPGISYDYDRKTYIVDPLKFRRSYVQ